MRPSSEPAFPFRLCTQAAIRLDTASLAPGEWLNLAAAHGVCEDMLCESLYSPFGEAMQPKRDPPLEPAMPEPGDVASNIERLIDIGLAWAAEDIARSVPGLYECLRRNATDAIEVEFRDRLRIGVPSFIEGCIYHIVRHLGNSAFSQFLRDRRAAAWRDFWWSLESAGSACLPIDEAIEWFYAALAEADSPELDRKGSDAGDMYSSAARIADRLCRERSAERATRFIADYLPHVPLDRGERFRVAALIKQNATTAFRWPNAIEPGHER